jgi:biopolymer transport protein ExbD
MRTNRSIRNRGRRDKKGPIDLDITSLLDILVILLVFLLKSYNSSGILLNVPKGVELPSSQSQSPNTTGVIVQVSPTTIWVDDKIIYDGTGPAPYSRNGFRHRPLYNELVKKKNEVIRIRKTAKGAKEFSGTINFIIDKTLRYSEIRKILYTAATAGYQRYKFVVLGEE